MKREYVVSAVLSLGTMTGIATVSLGTGSWLAVVVVTAVGLLGSAVAAMEYLRGRREGLAEFGAAVQTELARMTTADRLTEGLAEWDAAK